MITMISTMVLISTMVTMVGWLELCLTKTLVFMVGGILVVLC